MKKSLCFLLSIVSSCPSFVQGSDMAVKPEKRITCQELFSALETAVPKKRDYLLSPKMVAAIAAGVITTKFGKPVVQPVVQTIAPPTRSLSLMMDVILVCLGASVTGFGVYTFIGNEMGVIVSFKSTLKALVAHVAEWQNIISKLQQNQSDQEAKLAQAQLQIQKMLPLMEQLVQQSSNEQVLAKTLSHLYVECAGMVDRIKTLETTLQKIVELDGQTGEAAKLARAQELKKLVTRSNNIFGKPDQQEKAYWWQSARKWASAF